MAKTNKYGNKLTILEPSRGKGNNPKLEKNIGLTDKEISKRNSAERTKRRNNFAF